MFCDIYIGRYIIKNINVYIVINIPKDDVLTKR